MDSNWQDLNPGSEEEQMDVVGDDDVGSDRNHHNQGEGSALTFFVVIKLILNDIVSLTAMEVFNYGDALDNGKNDEDNELEGKQSFIF